MPAALMVPLVALLISLAHTASFGGEIINGKIAKKGTLPFMASVQRDGKHVCGGFLVSPNFVLTAAHCGTGGNMSVILGTHNLNKNVQRFNVKSKIKHDLYKKVYEGNDIMLLQLSEKVKFSTTVQKVKIPTKDKAIRPNTRCLVAGWGAIKTRGESVFDLRDVNVATIDISVCRKAWDIVNKNKKLPPDIICAGGYNTKHGACKGDSGGPLLCGGVAVGIVSFNQGGKL
ncbi:hypothetical protein AAFF_G00219320 [Aldrovandia affinis]|uniref:trypsin n=1 Tax=Aldrovandia affinis TaxID=143900 RepID=A0AAD7RGA8_9TELE|nr:hypothetical protein AAFF_G00219320 [Aldrovandia affinis]